MPSHRDISGVAAGMRSAAELIEAKFLEIGKSLEASVEILAKLSATFGSLRVELENEELEAATEDLRRVASQVAAVSASRSEERAALDRLGGLASTVRERVSRMRKAVKSVDVLAVNAKIAATDIKAEGDFQSFADRIGQSLRATQANLETLNTELDGVGKHLLGARQAETEFDRRHTESIRSIPKRLADSVDSVAQHRKAAAGTAAVVGRRSEEVSGKIGNVVMALQIGDITRQRIEHVDYAIAVLTAEDVAASEAERRQILALGCTLQSAQLLDTAEEFDGRLRDISLSLGELAADARAMVQLGNETYGASGQGGTFLLDLKEDVGQACALIDGFRTARSHADRAVTSVLAAAERLAEHASTVQSLEADIRLVGLNTTLKCGRLGVVGRPLSVIAQELRACGNVTAVEAEALLADLKAIVAAAGSLTGGNREGRSAEMEAIAGAMTSAVDRLDLVGKSLAAALASLRRDSDSVIALLAQTASQVARHEDISGLLRRAADELSSVSIELETEAAAPPEEVAAAFAPIFASYTMAKEREIHQRIVQDALGIVTELPAAAQSAPGEAALEDVLF